MDKQHLPQVAFVGCIALALALAYFTNDWLTALAIALAGAGLALAMRANQRGEPDPAQALAVEELADLRAAYKIQSAEIEELRNAMDELAGVVEAVASLPDPSSGVTDFAALEVQFDALKSEIDALAAPQDAMLARIDALEQGSAVRRRDAPRPQAADAVEPVRTGKQKRSMRSDLAAVLPGFTGKRRRNAAPVEVGTIPVFTPQLGSPAGYLVEAPETAGAEAALAPMIDAATALLREAPEATVFLRLSEPGEIAARIAHEAIAKLTPAEADRLLVLLPQSALAARYPEALGALLEHGCGFALEAVTDWSVDFRALAREGLRYVVVDGPAMARSAVAQKGDPTRLKAVLAARRIGLVTDRIETRAQIAAVETLLPDLLMGPALGEARVLETV